MWRCCAGSRPPSGISAEKWSPWRGADGRDEVIEVCWAKFAHRNGTYNWVTVGPGGSIVEIEREAQWDYRAGRRATEQWDHDGWIAA